MKNLLRRCSVVLCAIWVTSVADAATAAANAFEAKVERFIAEADALMNKGNLAGAEAKMTELIRFAPTQPSGYYNRGLVRQKLGRHGEAKQDLDQFLKLKPGADDGLELRARSRLELNDVSGALGDLTAALWTNENRHTARYLRANTLKEHGHYRDALKDYQRLSEVEPENDVVVASRAECELAVGENYAAKVSLEDLAKRNPDNPWVHYKLGEAKFALMQFRESVESFERAAAFKVDRADTSRSIGYARFGLGDYDGAIAALKEAIAAKPTITPYAFLILHVAIRRAQHPMGESPLRKAIPQWESTWTQAIGRYLLGEINDRALLDRAKKAKDSETRGGQLCEAFYYIGETRRLEKDGVGSEVLFEQALGTEKKTFIEYTFARAELGRIPGTSVSGYSAKVHFLDGE